MHTKVDADEQLRRVIEATVMVSADPLPAEEIASLVGVDVDAVDAACRELANAYEDEGRGFQLAHVAGGWRYQSHPSMAAVVEHMVREGQIFPTFFEKGEAENAK